MLLKRLQLKENNPPKNLKDLYIIFLKKEQLNI